MADRLRLPTPVLLLALTGACVFPSDNPTGIEFSWLFKEHEASDGDAGRRVRTCEGVHAETMAAELQDTGEPGRHGVFRFVCEDGFQTANDLARTASEAFVELHPRDYEVTLSVDDAGDHEVLAQRTVDVLARAVTLELWELARAPITWTLDLQHADACGDVGVALYYDDPVRDLAEPELDDEGAAVPLLYRTTLRSDRGLDLTGEAGSCESRGGLHRFEAFDAGRYRLERTVDGASCSVVLDLRETGTTVVDLSSGCG
ncbi:MAG: hypothetical protein IPK74_05525 [Deltaproteobacteria bacterium]|nr:hypothetical protein [Deltaproteobacteria bacterium]